MDDIQLIGLVESYPLLYDKQRADFKNKNKQNNVWDSIARSMNEEVDAVKARWTSLRQRFSRERQKLYSGAEATDEWELLKYLQFLDRVVKGRKTMSNVPLHKEAKIPRVDCKESCSPTSWVSLAEVLVSPGPDMLYSEEESLEVIMEERPATAESSRSRIHSESESSRSRTTSLSEPMSLEMLSPRPSTSKGLVAGTPSNKAAVRRATATKPRDEPDKVLSTLTSALHGMQNVIAKQVTEEDPDAIFGQFVASQLRLSNNIDKKEKMK